MQLWDFALRIQEELETVRKEKSLFQLERNKTQTVWETTKKNLEESEVELRSTTAERSEVDEQHREEMIVSLPPIHWSCCSPGPILTWCRVFRSTSRR